MAAIRIFGPFREWQPSGAPAQAPVGYVFDAECRLESK